jgi:hypothetical protein
LKILTDPGLGGLDLVGTIPPERFPRNEPSTPLLFIFSAAGTSNNPALNPRAWACLLEFMEIEEWEEP